MRMLTASEFKWITGEPYDRHNIDHILRLEKISSIISAVSERRLFTTCITLCINAKLDTGNACVIYDAFRTASGDIIVEIIDRQDFPELYKRYMKNKAFL